MSHYRTNSNIAPLVFPPESSKEQNYFAINTGSNTSHCFTKDQVQNFAFPEWKTEFKNSIGYASCQECCQASIRTGRYEQNAPSLQEPRQYYQMGPLVSAKAEGSISQQPYQFPLPLDYGPGTPEINKKYQPWFYPY